MSKERRLGRGLEALLGRPSTLGEAATGPEVESAPGSDRGIVHLSVQEIDNNPYQPRREFDETELSGLADSIREHGLLQPIVVRRVEGRYQLIAGERRLRAVTKCGLDTIAAQVRDVEDRELAELAIVENLQRKDLGPLEKAASFQRYLDTYNSTQEELAGRLKIDRSTVANLIRLLELPEDVRKALEKGTITQGHARALLPLGEEREQVRFVARIRDEGLSVRQTEAAVKEAIQSADGEPLAVAGTTSAERTRRRSDHLAELQQQLRTAVGAKVDIREGAKGRGRIVLHFANHAEFERLQQLLCGPTSAGQQPRAA